MPNVIPRSAYGQLVVGSLLLLGAGCLAHAGVMGEVAGRAYAIDAVWGPFPHPPAVHMVGLALVVYLLMFLAWVLVARAVRSASRVGLIPLAAFFLPVATLPGGLFSNDPYAYYEAGRVAHEGQDPYKSVVGSDTASPVHEYLQAWRGTRTPYGPIAIRLFQAFAAWAGPDPAKFIIGTRVVVFLLLVAMVLVVPLLPHFQTSSAGALVWSTALNPVVLVMGIGGLHLDVWAAALCLMTMFLCSEGRWTRCLMGVGVLSVAAAIRQPVVLLAVVPVTVMSRGLINRRRCSPAVAWCSAGLASACVGVMVFAFVTWVCQLGWGWVANLSAPALTHDSLVGLVVVGAGLSSVPLWIHMASVGLGASFGLYLFHKYQRRGQVATGGALFEAAVMYGAMTSFYSWYLVVPIAVVGFGVAPRGNRPLLVMTALAASTSAIFESQILTSAGIQLGRAMGVAVHAFLTLVIAASLVWLLRRVESERVSPSGKGALWRPV